MILYLDTSSLLKLYFQEEGTSAVRALTDQARILASSMIAYVETRSGLVRGHRGGRLTDEAYAVVLGAFETDWRTYVVRDVTGVLVRRAAGLAERHLLHGPDAIHLASAVILQRELGEAVTFLAADNRLRTAAADEGLLLAATS